MTKASEGVASGRGSPRFMPKGMMLWMLVVQILLVGGASLSQATPTSTRAPPPPEIHGHSLNDEDSAVEGGAAGEAQHTAYIDDSKAVLSQRDSKVGQSLDGPTYNLPSKSSSKNVVKRSAGGYDAYMASVGYDPMTAWTKKNEIDPGYEAYMQSVQYDPMMAWGKRQDKKDDAGYDAYMQSIGYDPMMAWAKRDHYDPYMQAMGYDPMSYYAKKTVKRSSDNPAFFPRQIFGGRVKSHDPYLDLYLPNQYMHNLKRSISPYILTLASNDWKRAPNDMGAQGFHEGIFTHNFGDFSPVKRGKREAVDSTAQAKQKRRPEMTSSGFYGDTFSGGFGDFSTMKKRRLGMDASGFHGDTFSNGFGDFSTMKKRRLGMGASGFYGDTFDQGFGDFSTMKKRRLGMDASGFYGDTFNQGFGDFSTMKKRRLGMGASGFYGDTFDQGFGDFSTMKKRRLGMDASGFYGDTFNQGFGDFSTMKKRRLGMGASGFHGDTFTQGFGDFSTMKKRRPEMDSSGFYGDTFNGGFGDFSTMKRADESKSAVDDSGFYGESVSEELSDYNPMKKSGNEEAELQEIEKEKEPTRKKREALKATKRRPDVDASEFYGDTFTGGFGDFYTMKKRLSEHDLRMLQLREEEGRPKRSLEANDIPTVEMKSPYERDLDIRNRRNVDTRSDFVYVDEAIDDSRDISKRSIDGSSPFYEDFENLNTMKGWR